MKLAKWDMIQKAVVIMMAATAGLQASVIYDFVGTGFDFEPMAFQLTVPNFVDPPSWQFVDFTCAQFDSSTNCEGVETFSYQDVQGALYGQLTFEPTNNAGYVFFFPYEAFGTTGVYTAADLTGGNYFNSGTLTVTETPEPTTTLLALSGFVLWSLGRLPKQRPTAA
jgi:hypothetical protein